MLDDIISVVTVQTPETSMAVLKPAILVSVS